MGRIYFLCFPQSRRRSHFDQRQTQCSLKLPCVCIKIVPQARPTKNYNNVLSWMYNWSILMLNFCTWYYVKFTAKNWDRIWLSIHLARKKHLHLVFCNNLRLKLRQNMTQYSPPENKTLRDELSYTKRQSDWCILYYLNRGKYLLLTLIFVSAVRVCPMDIRVYNFKITVLTLQRAKVTEQCGTQVVR
jgi:hypothetical protein